MAETRTAVHRIIDEIIDGILRGRYVPEQRLVTTEFTERMGTSLSPVREAFHVLAGEGVLEIIPNRGAIVRRLSIDDMIHGFEILTAVGPLALRKFAPRLSEPAVQKELSRLQKDIAGAADSRNAAQLFMAVARSHRYVNSLTGNPYFDAVIDRLHLETFYRQVSEIIPGSHWDRFLENYRKTFNSLNNNAVAQAERSLANHYRWCIRLLEKQKLKMKAAAETRTSQDRKSKTD